MIKRYKIISRIDSGYIKGCPVILSAGAILIDTKTEDLLVQLKFENLVEKNIKAIYIGLDCRGVSDEILKPLEEFVYLDLNAGFRETFADRTTIKIPDDKTRKVSINLKKVLFADDTFWENTEQLTFVTLEKQPSIEVLEDFKDQFFRELDENMQISKHQNILMLNEDYWMCSCGAFNFNSDCYCSVCKMSKEKLIKVIDKEYLEERLKFYNDEQGKIKEIQQIALETKQKTKIKRIKVTISGILLAVLVAGAIFYIKPIVIKNQQYTSAVKLLNDGKYDNALSQLQEIGEYKDSKQLIEKAYYHLGMKSMNDKEYLTAIDKFQKVTKKNAKLYSDSQKDIEECKKQSIAINITLANKAISAKNYGDANKYINEILKFDNNSDDAKKMKGTIGKKILEENKKLIESQTIKEHSNIDSKKATQIVVNYDGYLDWNVIDGVLDEKFLVNETSQYTNGHPCCFFVGVGGNAIIYIVDKVDGSLYGSNKSIVNGEFIYHLTKLK